MHPSGDTSPLMNTPGDVRIDVDDTVEDDDEKEMVRNRRWVLCVEER